MVREYRLVCDNIASMVIPEPLCQNDDYLQSVAYETFPMRRGDTIQLVCYTIEMVSAGRRVIAGSGNEISEPRYNRNVTESVIAQYVVKGRHLTLEV